MARRAAGFLVRLNTFLTQTGLSALYKRKFVRCLWCVGLGGAVRCVCVCVHWHQLLPRLAPLWDARESRAHNFAPHPLLPGRARSLSVFLSLRPVCSSASSFPHQFISFSLFRSLALCSLLPPPPRSPFSLLKLLPPLSKASAAAAAATAPT